MTAGDRVRRLLARVCSPRTMNRIVDPTLADARWEHGRPVWLGYLALARALALHAVMSSPGVAVRVWSDAGHAMPKAAGIATAAATLGSMPLIAFAVAPLLARPGLAPLPLALLLLPGALLVMLPPALLVAIPIAMKDHAAPRLARRTIALSLCCAAVMFVLMARVLPETNQSFRVRVSGDPQLARGAAESGFTGIRERLEALRSVHGGEAAARGMEYSYYSRWALICAPIAAGLLALALALSAAGRKHPLGVGIAAMAFYVVAVLPLYPFLALVARSSHVPPIVLAWTPIVAVGAVAAVLLSRSARQ